MSENLGQEKEQGSVGCVQNESTLSQTCLCSSGWGERWDWENTKQHKWCPWAIDPFHHSNKLMFCFTCKSHLAQSPFKVVARQKPHKDLVQNTCRTSSKPCWSWGHIWCLSVLCSSFDSPHLHSGKTLADLDFFLQRASQVFTERSAFTLSGCFL